MSTFAAAISAGQILSVPNSSGTPQHVIIDGTFEMGSITGYTFASGSDLIFAEDALLLVNSTSSGLGKVNLNILNSTLHGCEDLWEGIKVLQGRGIGVENSTIEDAIHAVTAERNTKIALRGNTFRNNHIGFYVEASPNNQPHTIHHEIRNNVFTSDAALLASVSGFNAYAYAGISVTDMALLDLDGKVNTFEHLQNGILATHSQVRINSETTFTDIQPESPFVHAYGIWMFGEKGRPIANLYFDGNTSDQGDETFLECQTGISSTFADLEVKNCFFNDCETGIFSDHTLAPTKGFKLNHSDFLNVPNGVDFIASGNADPSKFFGSLFGPIEIHDNSFTVDEAGSGVCIRLKSSNQEFDPDVKNPNLTFFHHSLIRNNHFFLHASGYTGVALLSCSGVRLLQNEFDTNLNGGEEEYTCILVDGYSTGHRVGYNTMRATNITGSVEYDEDYDRYGLTMIESPWNKIFCNVAGSLSIGMHFRSHCEGTVFEGNQMFSNVYGLAAGYPGGASFNRLGIQNNLGNRWSENTGADAEWFTVLDDKNIYESQFIVYEDDDPVNILYWPDVIVFGNSSTYDWFVENNELDEPMVCLDAEEPGPDDGEEPGDPSGSGDLLTPLDWAVINQDTLLNDISDGIVFNLEWGLADKFVRFPDLLSTYAAADTYLDSWESTPAGELFDVYHQLRTYSPDTLDLISILDWLEDAQYLTDSIESLNASVIDSVSAFPALDSMRVQLYAVQTNLSTLMDTLASEYEDLLEGLETELSGISPSNDPETRMWKYLTIFVDEALDPGTYTNIHVDSLELLIDDCPEIGGFGVVMATGLLRYLTNDNTWAHDTCSSPPSARTWKPNLTPISNSNLAIAPNPGGDWFDIRNADDGTIEVVDIYGRLVFSGNISKIGTRIDTREWHSGTYIIRISSVESGTNTSLIWMKR